MQKIFVILLLVGLSIGNLSGQDRMNGGVITYKLTELEGEVSMRAQMMKGSEIALTFLGQKQKMTMAFMMGMVEINILQLQPDSGGIVLTNMMGKKVKIVGERPQKEKTPDFTMEHFITDTKSIAGYDCHKVKLLSLIHI